MMKKLENNAVFIPGGSSANEAIKEESILLIAELPNSKQEEMFKILNTLGGKSLFVPINVSGVENVRQSIETIVAKLGQIDEGLNSTLGRSYPRLREQQNSQKFNISGIKMIHRITD